MDRICGPPFSFAVVLQSWPNRSEVVAGEGVARQGQKVSFYCVKVPLCLISLCDEGVSCPFWPRNNQGFQEQRGESGPRGTLLSSLFGFSHPNSCLIKGGMRGEGTCKT